MKLEVVRDERLRKNIEDQNLFYVLVNCEQSESKELRKPEKTGYDQSRILE